MKKSCWTLFFCAMLLLTILTFGREQNIAANSSDSIDTLYKQAVTENRINPTTYSANAFRCMYHEGLQIYTQQLRAGMPFCEYDEWLANVGFGAMPDGSGVDPDMPAVKPRSAAANVERFVHDIRKGDILVVQGSGFGHAAIATSNNYVLEMHGGGNIVNWTLTGIADNNRQYTTRDWIKLHIKNWTQIWRPRQGIGTEAATYADYKFWSSTHSLKKNRHITYGLGAGPKVTNPNYCSKMVWQAFYFGTGSKKVAKGTSFFITPSSLPNSLTDAYKAYKVGRY